MSISEALRTLTGEWMTRAEANMRVLTDEAIDDVESELNSAVSNYPQMASPHEGFAILKEEVDELWDEVKKKPSQRSKAMMRKEACQVAAMAIRFMIDVCEDE